MRNKLIPKHQTGLKILKWLSDFGNALIAGDSGAATSAAIASGYKYNPRTHRWELSKENLKEAEDLRNNLAVISTFSPTLYGTAFTDAVTSKIVFPALGKLYKYSKNEILSRLISNRLNSNITKTVLPKTSQELKTITFNPTPVKSKKSNLIFYQRPKSKITESERLGIPKGDRNNKPSVKSPTNSLYIGAARDTRKLPYSDQDILSADPLTAANMRTSNTVASNNFKKQYNQILDRTSGNVKHLDDFNSLLLDYIKDLPDPDPMFLNSNYLQSAYVQDYRKYLYNIGYDAASISDYDLAKLIAQQYKDLTSKMSGKTKGMVMWHGSPTMFDSFDYGNTGMTTGNMGYGGPGNYFSSNRTLYGSIRGKGVLNLQPYLINSITQTPYISHMRSKGLLPHYLSPTQYESETYNNIIKKLINELPENKSTLYIDDVSMAPVGTLTPVKLNTEYMFRSNTGIKSLFPHPSTFIRNSDGTVSILRDWNDIRVNYKKGGKLNEK